MTTTVLIAALLMGVCAWAYLLGLMFSTAARALYRWYREAILTELGLLGTPPCPLGIEGCTCQRELR